MKNLIVENMTFTQPKHIQGIKEKHQTFSLTDDILLACLKKHVAEISKNAEVTPEFTMSVVLELLSSKILQQIVTVRHELIDLNSRREIATKAVDKMRQYLDTETSNYIFERD